ncbi:GNAT family N-acetyltransferase [Pseudonocardia sp. TRM90224]|uniref:GNAT family N-acetyltransferase n=1 Tax=Pseudonocardia sp. TRM90224 TaxID=2812678 RepID=UPI001E28D968|nr:GNAT family N-acetyltransferase [Pseudonocardia sp. TRM90224]
MTHGGFTVGDVRYVVRRARRDDLAELVAMLADDPLGAAREHAPSAAYGSAFERIDADPNQLLACLTTDPDGRVVGTLQLTVIAGLSRGGALRGQIEAVRVHSEHRGRGVGTPFLQWAVEELRLRGCVMAQLTTDRSRVDAHRFYERLGFVDSHRGLKLAL